MKKPQMVATAFNWSRKGTNVEFIYIYIYIHEIFFANVKLHIKDT